MNKISLSYTTMNAAINEPHTYLNKMMGLKTFQSDAMAAGDAAHRIAQDHVSGVKLNEILTLKKLPTFELVERFKWDDQMRVRFDINEKYYFTGFLDADDPKRLELGEFKFGKTWSAGEFARLVQWKLYSLGRPGYKKMYFLNAPTDPNLWMPETIKVYREDFTPKHKTEAEEFIAKGIKIIENIREEVEKSRKIRKEKGYTGRSRWCWYQGCEFCTE